MPAHRRTLAVIALFSAIIGAAVLGLAELSVRAFWPHDIRVGVLAGGSLAIPDPVLGHRLRPGSHTLRTGPEFSYEAVISEQGFRDAFEHAPGRIPGVQRILLVGDSFTFGDTNAYADIWPVVFERALIQRGCEISVIKAGVPGYGTREEVLYLEELQGVYRPDFVVLTFVRHDLQGARPLAQTPEPRQDLVKPPAWHTIEALRSLLMQSDDLFVHRIARGGSAPYYSFPFDRTVQERVELTQSLIGRANRISTDAGAFFAVLSLPQEFEVVAGARGFTHAGIDLFAFDRAMSEFSAREGFVWIPVLRKLQEEYRSKRERLYHRYDGHLNEMGNRVVGEFFAERFFAWQMESSGDCS